MVEQQELEDTIAPHFTATHLVIAGVGAVAALLLVVGLGFALMRRKNRRVQQAAMPRAYLLPMYVGRQSLPPAYEVERSALHRPASIAHSPRALAGVSLENAQIGEDSEYEVYIWGSVQHRTSRRRLPLYPAHHRQNTHESARESVATLPRYEGPPSYKSDNGFQASI